MYLGYDRIDLETPPPIISPLMRFKPLTIRLREGISNRQDNVLFFMIVAFERENTSPMSVTEKNEG